MTNISATTSAARIPDPSAVETPLEPRDPSILEPRQPNLVDKIVAGTFCGILGAGVGGILGMGAVFATGSVHARFAPAAAIGLTAIGAGVGALLGIESLMSSARESEQARIAKETGASTLDTARTMIATWDTDDNGRIDRPTEDTRTESRHDRAQQRTVRVETTAADVWDAATRRDTVTDVDLARLMSKFDADRSGTMSELERAAFDEAHGVFVVRERAR